MTALDPRSLRHAFGSFMTGVTVVTTRGPDGTCAGFTANSFSSVSLDPPLVLVCPGKFLSSYKVFAGCTRFAVSVLAEGQEDVSNIFAGSKGERFAQVRHSPDPHGNPWIDGALAQFSCRTHQSMPAGDHCILIGQVETFAHRQGRGLGYADGQYFSLGLERAALEKTPGSAICGAIIEHKSDVLLEQTANGLRPPQIARPERGQLRQDLMADLTARNIPARLGPAYSVFDAGDRHSVYFLASTTSAPATGNIIAVPTRDLAQQNYTNAPIKDMMTRFGLEARRRDFSLYLGDARQGDTHSLSERI